MSPNEGSCSPKLSGIFPSTLVVFPLEIDHAEKTRIAVPLPTYNLELLPRMDLPLVQNYPEAAVGALIVNEKEEMLLVRSYKWGTKYTVPGGHIELGERSETAVK